ncbi:Cd(II)/Pb(II)-responsive transcriptional regulator [Stutzerimonas stutzeri]|nr:Cd(II)/Pb(II)-responsive transcriptional regulator [Stutzerimonas stutzeri]RTM19554.1 Cd(II)/Pb(II)-responsive transcriptional regulator [Stutzerimonas stutzeri]
MRIGQLARLIGIDTQTIRFYEQQGLLPPPDRQANGYRVYTEKHGERLAFIRSCRILNLSLPEIHALQRYQDDPRQPCTAVNALLDEHISQVKSQITALQSLERQLVSQRANCSDGREVEACGILAGISEDACIKLMALGLTGLLAVVYTNRGAQKLNRMDLPIRGLNLHLVRLNFAVSSITLNHSGRTGRPCRCYAQHFTFFNKYFKGGICY